MKQYCVGTDASLIECMRVIELGRAGIALAVDSELKLIGTISDGDLRKALLNGCTLDSPGNPHIKRNCFSVLATVPRPEVLDIMKARRFEQVPIVDDHARVVGLHLLHDFLGNTERPNWAVVMAGGKGMRLRPLTENIPKPMIRVAGRPILERIILHIVSYGLRRAYLREQGVDSLRAVEKCKQHPGKMWVVRDKRMLPLLPLSPPEQPWHSSQYHSLPEVYVQNASLEIAWTRLIFNSRTIAGNVIMPFFTDGYEGFDVNQDYDWELAELLVRRGQASLPVITRPPITLS